jgi:hypothetical protein
MLFSILLVRRGSSRSPGTGNMEQWQGLGVASVGSTVTREAAAGTWRGKQRAWAAWVGSMGGAS